MCTLMCFYENQMVIAAVKLIAVSLVESHLETSGNCLKFRAFNKLCPQNINRLILDAEDKFYIKIKPVNHFSDLRLSFF